MQPNTKHTQSAIFTSTVNTTANLYSSLVDTKSIYTKVNPSSSPVNTGRTQPHTSTLMANAAINVSSSDPVENMQITAPPEFEQLITWDTEKFNCDGRWCVVSHGASSPRRRIQNKALVWHLEWPKYITDILDISGNPNETISNSDLELAGIVAS